MKEPEDFLKETFSTVRLQLAANVSATFHSYEARISNTAINSDSDHDGSMRAMVLSVLLAENPDSIAIEVGVVDKLREEIVELGILKHEAHAGIKRKVVETENSLINDRFHSKYVADLKLVDLVTPFDPTPKQISDALGSLNACSVWFASLPPDEVTRHVDIFLRSKYLSAVNCVTDWEHRTNTLRLLNDRLRFIRLQRRYPRFEALYVSVIGNLEFTDNRDQRKVTSTAACGALYLERMNETKAGIRKAPFITSSGMIFHHAAKLPHGTLPSSDHPKVMMVRMVQILNALLRNDRFFTGRIGIKNRVGDKVDWINEAGETLSMPSLLTKLPDDFRLTQEINVGGIRNRSRGCKERVQGLMAENSGSIKLLSSLFHLTHRKHLESILQHGILSGSLARDQGRITNDISDPEVQRRRNALEPCYGRSIHDYAPLYLNPKNPMLSVRRNIQDELVILRISPTILKSFDHVFSDGNAASIDTQFSYDVDVLESAWSVLVAGYWSDFPDGKRKRCAEVLVFPCVPPKFIVEILCLNPIVARQLACKTDLPVTSTPEMFFSE
jgi:hypothetical protein